MMGRHIGPLVSSCAVSVTVLLASFSLSAQSPPTADWVARQAQDRDTGRDSRTAMRMKLFDRHNRVRERALSTLILLSLIHI